jgi:hypothetical protein
VFGSNINEAARLETLTKTFATPIVGSDPDGASDAETVVLLSRHSRPRAAVRRRPPGECRTWGSSWRLIELVCFVPRTDIDAAISPAIRKATGACPTKQQVCRNLPRAAIAKKQAGLFRGAQRCWGRNQHLVSARDARGLEVIGLSDFVLLILAYLSRHAPLICPSAQPC